MLQTNKREFFRDCHFILNSNFFYFSIPDKPIIMKDNKYDKEVNGPVKALPEGWNCWDRIDIQGHKTCEELKDYLKEKYNIDLDMFISNGKVIITFFLIKKKKK